MSRLCMFLCRHAPRAGVEDHITGSGEQEAYALGKALHRRYPKQSFIGLCSERRRTRETVAAILAGAGASEAPIAEDAALQNADFDPRWASADSTALHEDVTLPNAALNSYLRFGHRRPDPHVLAPREVAARLVHVLYRHLDDAPAPRTIVAVTHSGMIEVFLAYLLDVRRVEAIGGTFDYLEGVTLRFEERPDASFSMRASFRGRTYRVAEDRLRVLLREGARIDDAE